MTRLEKLEQKIKELERRLCCKTQFFDTYDDFPDEGSTGVLYIDEETGNIYIWDGVAYSTADAAADHGSLTGLGDDDHTQYALLAGRATGQTINGGTAANEDITINGTTHATKTTSLVIIQPTGGDVTIGGGTTAAELRLLEPSASGTNYTAFKATAQAANLVYTLPPSFLSGGILTDASGNGTLTWTAPSSGTPTLAENQIAFGDAGNLMTGSSSFTWTPTTFTSQTDVFIGSGNGGGIVSGSGITSIGDIGGNFNEGLFSVDGVNNLAYFRNAADTAFFGINTATPTIALEVVGSVRLNGGTGSLDLTGGAAVIGDAFGGGNNTTILIDDVVQNIVLNRAVQFSSYGAGALTTDGGGNITAVSDERLKNIQGNYEAGLDEILNINPIIYKWTPESKLDQKFEYAGFSAQNVKENLPLSTGENSEGFLSLQDRAITCALVNSVRTLNTKIEDLQELCDKQQEQIEQLLKLIK